MDTMGNKQGELEGSVLLESCDLVAITETWLDESHDWSAATSCSEDTGEEGGAEGLPSMSRDG